jgi:hypothetical protein
MPRYSDELVGTEGEPVSFQELSRGPQIDGTVASVSDHGQYASIEGRDGKVYCWIPFYAITLLLSEAEALEFHSKKGA